MEQHITEQDVQNMDILTFVRKVKEILKEKKGEIFEERKKQIEKNLIIRLSEDIGGVNYIKTKKITAGEVNSLMAVEN